MRVFCKGGVFVGAVTGIRISKLAIPGSRALYKVYPITSSKRQWGSKVVEITQPAG